MFTTVPISGSVHSSVRRWLRLEGLMAFLLATYLYAHEGGSWLALAAALLSAKTGLPFALVWGAHIGFDRALGYG